MRRSPACCLTWAGDLFILAACEADLRGEVGLGNGCNADCGDSLPLREAGLFCSFGPRNDAAVTSSTSINLLQQRADAALVSSTLATASKQASRLTSATSKPACDGGGEASPEATGKALNLFT